MSTNRPELIDDDDWDNDDDDDQYSPALSQLQKASSYNTGALFLGFLCVLSIIWMVRTSEPKRVIDDWNIGRDRRGTYIETESHYEKQRDSVGTILGWLAILGFGGGALWCWSRGAELAPKSRFNSDRPIAHRPPEPYELKPPQPTSIALPPETNQASSLVPTSAHQALPSVPIVSKDEADSRPKTAIASSAPTVADSAPTAILTSGASALVLGIIAFAVVLGLFALWMKPTEDGKKLGNGTNENRTSSAAPTTTQEMPEPLEAKTDVDPNVILSTARPNGLNEESPQREGPVADVVRTIPPTPWTPSAIWTYSECMANGKDYFRARDYDKAVACFSRALELDRTKEALESRAAASYRNADYAQTVEDCTAVLELDPWRAAAYQLRSMANDELGKFGKAAFDAQRARELDPAVGERRSAYD